MGEGIQVKGRFAWRFTKVAAVVSILMAAGCSGPSSHPVTYDFVASFPLAEVLTPTAAIDFGSPEARPHLIEGWGHDERAGTTSFVWAMGDSSWVRWFVATPRAAKLYFRCWPYAAQGSAPQTVLPIVNERMLQAVPIPRAGTYSVTVPVDALVPGWNRLEFRYAYHRDDHLAEREHRQLAVAWDWLRIDPAPKPVVAPFAERDRKPPAVTLPFGSDVNHYLELAPESELVIDGIVPWGQSHDEANPPILRVEVETSSGIRKNFDLAAGTALRRVPLLEATGNVARISFRALPDQDRTGTAAGLTLLGPTLRVPRPAVRPPSGRDRTSNSPTGKARRPNVIIYLIDSLRTDHLGYHGYTKGTSPNIDHFAENATVFTRAIAQTSFTKGSVASIFTSLLPPTHGVGKHRTLPSAAVTLAERLRDQEYVTAALVANPSVAPSFGFSQGFQTYDLVDSADGRRVTASSAELNRAVFAWLAEHSSDQPFLLYVHTMDAHTPYAPPDRHRARFAAPVHDTEVGSLKHMWALQTGRVRGSAQLARDLSSLYDAEIAHNDESFGKFIDRLKDLALYEPSIVVLVADHGEEFYDHNGWEHSRKLYAEQLSVPLIVKFPHGWGAGRKISAMVQHVDILPTILDYVGATVPEGLNGESLLPLLGSPPTATASRPAFSYLNIPGKETESIVTNEWQLIRYRVPDGRRPPLELFSTVDDQHQQTNLAYDLPVTAGYLETLLKAEAMRGVPELATEQLVVPEHVEERLRALGYLD